MKTHRTSIILTLALTLALISATTETRAQRLQPTLLSWHNGESQSINHTTNFRHASANLLNQFEFQLEKWMTDLASWDLLPSPRIEYNAPVINEPNEVEAWMMNPADWNSISEIETDAEPGYERWMSQPFVASNSELEENTLENWMLNTSDWASGR